MVAKKHPSVYNCIHEFQKEQGDTETVLLELRMGRKVKRAPQKKWRDLQDRIRAVVNDYNTYKENDDILGYLRTLGHHFQL